MVDLERLEVRKMPLSYGTARCRLVLNDARYNADVVALRNDERVNQHIHHDPLTEEMHDAWLTAQLGRSDSFNFVVLVHQSFAGTISIYDVRSHTAEVGRFVLKEGPVRMYAPAAYALCQSFAFEVLALPEIHCKVMEDNQRTQNFVTRVGWKRDPRYDEEIPFDGGRARTIGYSIAADDWPAIFERSRGLVSRLLASG